MHDFMAVPRRGRAELGTDSKVSDVVRDHFIMRQEQTKALPYPTTMQEIPEMESKEAARR